MPEQTKTVPGRCSLHHALIETLYDSACIRRWNDLVRPTEFMELDKQAHKMIIAYVLAKTEEPYLDDSLDWLGLIEGGIFEFLHRIVLTDIKPPVFHKMMSSKGRELNQWVLRRLSDELAPVKGNFTERFERYLFDESFAAMEKRLLKAAHFLATQWEFKIIYKVCPFVYGIDKIKEEIENQLEDHYDLRGVQKLALGKKTAGFVDLCGQLRFQRRWSQSPRIPETSVLGHMLLVAIMTYLSLIELDACNRRIINGFLAALFHDLPEVMTRDITSPVKAAVEGLDSIIKEYENIEIRENLLPLLPKSWHRQIRYFIEDEFSNKIMRDGRVVSGVTVEELNGPCNNASCNPVDGEVIRTCDHLSALIEASLSMKHGITSRHLKEGRERLLEKYKDKRIGTIDYGRLFESFA